MQIVMILITAMILAWVVYIEMPSKKPKKKVEKPEDWVWGDDGFSTRRWIRDADRREGNARNRRCED